MMAKLSKHKKNSYGVFMGLNFVDTTATPSAD